MPLRIRFGHLILLMVESDHFAPTPPCGALVLRFSGTVNVEFSIAGLCYPGEGSVSIKPPPRLSPSH